MGLLVLILFCCFAGYFPFRFLLRKAGRRAGVPQYLCLLVYCIALLIFISVLSDAAEYNQQITFMDSYTPLAQKHLPTIIVFWIFSVTASVALWLKGRHMPPLLFVLCLSFLVIGVAGCTIVLVQIADSTGAETDGAFAFLPLVHILLSLTIVFLGMAETAAAANQKVYKGRLLNFLNRTLANVYLQPLWVAVLLLPVVIVTVAILTLFGQDSHALTKVFTDTTTWHFSQQQHPPFLESQGHYLCTVAARGHHKLVKPLRLGYRRGSTILVNRQLLVANAFEELLETHCPWLHRPVRKWYNRHGFPLSQYIMKPAHSNLVYLLMKPLEYIFVVVLYLCCTRPEDKIASQYTLPR